MEMFTDPWEPRRVVPLSEIDLSRYAMGGESEEESRERIAACNRADYRYAEAWYPVARLVDARAPNVAGWAPAAGGPPCPLSCPDCRGGGRPGLAEEFSSAGEDLTSVVQRLAEAIGSDPRAARAHEACACLLQRAIHDHALTPSAECAGVTGSRISKNSHIYEGVFPAPGPWSRLPFVAKLYDYEEMGSPLIWSMALNEILVGLYATNSLRHRIPNFRYVYGMYADHSARGSKLFADKKRWCPYGFLERVDGDTYTQWCAKSVGRADFWESATSVLLQALLAVTVAWEEFHFSHNDLHIGNILVEELDEPRRITYRLRSGREVTLETRVIARIIDLDSAHVELRVPAELSERAGAGAPRALDRERGVLRTGGLTSAFNLAPSGPNTLYDAARLASTWALSTGSHIRDSGVGGGLPDPRDLRAWLITPFLGGRVAKEGDFVSWSNDYLSCTPSGVAISLEEYVEHVLARAPRSLPCVVPPGVAPSDADGGGAGARCLARISPTLDAMAAPAPSAGATPVPLHARASDLEHHPCAGAREALRAAVALVRAELTSPEYSEQMDTVLHYERAFGPLYHENCVHQTALTIAGTIRDVGDGRA